MTVLSYGTAQMIDRPPGHVFDFCADLRNEEQWNPTLEYVEKLTDGPIGVGTRYRAKWSNAGPVDVEVVRFDRPTLWETRSRAGGLEITVRSTLTGVGAQTRYETRLEIKARGLARLYAPMALFAMRRSEPRNLRNIKKALEAINRGC